MSAEALNTILLSAVVIGGIWWWNKGFPLPVGNTIAGLNTPAITALTREQWTLVIAPLLTLVVVFLVIPGLFPGFTARYLKNDGPVWMLLFVLGLMALAAVIPHSFLPVRLVAFGVLGIAFLLSVGPPALDSLPSLQSKPATETTRAPAAPERRVARVPDDPCDNVYRMYRLSNRPKPMLRVSGCTVGWMVEEGGVILTDEDGNKQPPVRKGEDRGYGPPAKTWQAEGDYAVVRARFYRS